jgi:hypothetical protein
MVSEPAWLLLDAPVTAALEASPEAPAGYPPRAD